MIPGTVTYFRSCTFEEKNLSPHTHSHLVPLFLALHCMQRRYFRRMEMLLLAYVQASEDIPRSWMPCQSKKTCHYFMSQGPGLGHHVVRFLARAKCCNLKALSSTPSPLLPYSSPDPARLPNIVQRASLGGSEQSTAVHTHAAVCRAGSL